MNDEYQQLKHIHPHTHNYIYRSAFVSVTVVMIFGDDCMHRKLGINRTMPSALFCFENLWPENLRNNNL